ncbi:MAG TPA: ROK family transcriptional regulator [Clostridiales bacterium]|nr:ROK family transcriptional regulator [Clostridiales bacterium]
MKRVAGNQRLVRETNQKLIIDAFRQRGMISRAELAKLLNLSAPSVSSNIDQLLRAGMLREVGEGDSIGGRRPILLKFNYRYRFIGVVDLSSDVVRVVLGDLQGNIVAFREIVLPELKIGGPILEDIIRSLHVLLKDNNVHPDKLKAIVVGLPAVINDETGRLLLAPQFQGWDGINIKDKLEKNFNARVIVKNDVNMAALGECRYGAGKRYNNMVYVGVETGIGAGIIIDGKLYEGSRNAAGEIGHFISSYDEGGCRVDQFGPLESRLAVPAIIKRIKDGIAKGCRSKALELAGGNIQGINLGIVRKAAMMGDGYVLNIIHDSARMLGWVIANINVVLDVDLVIIGGRVIELGQHFIRPLRQTIDRLSPLSISVVYASLGSKAVVYGGFALGLDYVFNHILDDI